MDQKAMYLRYLHFEVGVGHEKQLRQSARSDAIAVFRNRDLSVGQERGFLAETDSEPNEGNVRSRV